MLEVALSMTASFALGAIAGLAAAFFRFSMGASFAALLVAGAVVVCQSGGRSKAKGSQCEEAGGEDGEGRLLDHLNGVFHWIWSLSKREYEGTWPFVTHFLGCHKLSPPDV